MPDNNPHPPDTSSSGDSTEDAIKFFKENGRAILLTLAIVLGGTGLYSYAQSANKKANLAAWKDIAEIEQQMRGRGDTLQKEYIDTIKQARKKHKDTPAATYIDFRVIALLFDRGQDKDITQAITIARDFLRTQRAAPQRAQMQLNLAQLLMVQGKYAEAKRELDQALTTAPEYLKGEILLAHVQCTEGENLKSVDGETPAASLSRLEPVRDAYLNLSTKGQWPRDQVRNVAGFGLSLVKDRQFHLRNPNYKAPTPIAIPKPKIPLTPTKLKGTPPPKLDEKNTSGSKEKKPATTPVETPAKAPVPTTKKKKTAPEANKAAPLKPKKSITP